MSERTDRELLELAAKVGAPPAPAHTQGWRYSQFGPQGEGMYAASDRSLLWFWNPLTDDGDALRLAVKLEFGLSIEGRVTLVHNRSGVFEEQAQDFDGDTLAATRRAIVRAAAAIGEQMP